MNPTLALRATGLALVLAIVTPASVAAQGAAGRGASALAELIRDLAVTPRVLMIGAHPDDEDTNVITWLARGRGVETAYLSLTRGDGGQNLIGDELGEALGVVRTEELLAARRIDGGQQFFTRAYDFGFSKSAAETYRHWPKDSILRDVVTVVRAFKPHVIISLFSGTPRDGHGHHQVAGLLAREAYDLAGDSVRMPPDINTWTLPPWTPLKFYRSARGMPDSATLRVNVGEYNPVLGRSYAEIAGESRSQHKSQGFGSLQRKGLVWGYLRREHTRVNAGEEPRSERSLFDGIDTTWRRFMPDARGDRVLRQHQLPSLDSLIAALEAARGAALFGSPERVLPLLGRVQRWLYAVAPSGFEDEATMRAYTRLHDLNATAENALAELGEALQIATGVAVDAIAERELVSRDSVPLTVTVYNRGPATLHVTPAYIFSCQRGAPQPDGSIRINQRIIEIDSTAAILPDSARVWKGVVCAGPSSAWWLSPARRGDMFAAASIRLPEDRLNRPLTVPLHVEVGDPAVGLPFSVEAPVVVRYADPVRGEVRRPVARAPTLSVRLSTAPTEYVPANRPVERTVSVTVRSAAAASRNARVTIRAPRGMSVDSATRTVELPRYGAQRSVSFRLSGALPTGRHELSAVVESGGERFDAGYTLIEYEHTRPQYVPLPARTTLEAVDVQVPRGLRVAYVRGVADNVAPAIEQLGIPVRVVGASEIERLDPARDPVLVIGPRAYEANDTLAAHAAAVLAFARRGGTVVVQYGQHEMTQPGIMPHPIALERRADRVTEEDAPVRVLDPSAGVLHQPNRITDRDFAGWVQERSLYMPRSFDPQYAAPLSINDPGEPANQGAILVTPVGRGTYVYTTLAFFRQLPAGHPGAARLFVNLLAAGRSSP